LQRAETPLAAKIENLCSEQRIALRKDALARPLALYVLACTIPNVQQSDPATASYGPQLPKPLARLKKWLADHHMTLMAIADTPHSIALGSAIGIFFGFTPLWSVKTLLSIGVAWVLRCNKIAAAIAVTVHDVLIFIMPAIYYAEYRIGCWTLGRALPAHRVRLHFGLHDYLNWGVFSRLVWPAFVGSLFFALPSAVLVYFLVRMLLSRSRTSGTPE
jgi:uncharacterized protein (DUF2062 family)